MDHSSTAHKMFPSMVNHPADQAWRPWETFVNPKMEEKLLAYAEKKVADLPVDQIERILFNLEVSPVDLNRRLKILKKKYPNLSPKKLMQKAYAAFTVNLVVSEEEI